MSTKSRQAANEVQEWERTITSRLTMPIRRRLHSGSGAGVYEKQKFPAQVT